MFAHKCNEIPQEMPGFMQMLRVRIGGYWKLLCLFVCLFGGKAARFVMNWLSRYG